MVFENIGIDPHFAHADLYCELALTRVPDPDKAAFADRRKEIEREQARTVHEWKRSEANPNHWSCESCKITVAVPPGLTADAVAAKAGFKHCKPEGD